MSPTRRGGGIWRLRFHGGFREELLERIGYKPELAPPAEPASVRHLGGLRFEADGNVVEFKRTEGKKTPLRAVLQLDTEEKAAQLYRRLKAAGVYADVKGKEVRLTDESFWAMAVIAGVTPEGYQRIYPLPRDKYRDLYVFKRVVGNDVYYQFVVKHDGVWRAVGGKYDEKGRYVMLQHAEREVLEALREAVKKALKGAVERAVGMELGEIGEHEGVHYVVATRPVLTAFEERALAARPSESTKTAPPEAYLRGGSIVVRHNGVEHEIEFALVKGSEGVLADSSLYPALKALGVRAELMPNGVKLYRDGMWGLLAAAVEQTLERSEKPELPPGISLLKARPERGHYVFSVEAKSGRYIYSVLHVGGQWTAMGGKVRRDGRVELMHSEEEVAKAHAGALNELLAGCIAEGRCAQKEARRTPDGRSWYFRLNAADLGELGARAE